MDLDLKKASLVRRIFYNDILRLTHSIHSIFSESILTPVPLKVGRWVFRTKNPLKIRNILRKHSDTLFDYHTLLWPGEEVVNYASKRARRNLPRNVSNPCQDLDWFPISVMSTSMVFALLTYGFGHSKRHLCDRQYTYQFGWAELLSKVVQAGISAQLWIQRLGDDEWVLCRCWRQGQELVLHGCALWTTTFYDMYVRESWAHDLRNHSKTWINQLVGNGIVKVSEFLGFMLDPTHFKELKQKMLPRAYCYITQLAAIVEDSKP